MPVATVTRHKDGGWVALCSCGAMGSPRTDKGDAYADKARHQREGCLQTPVEVVQR
jgi:hypothetical protein